MEKFRKNKNNIFYSIIGTAAFSFLAYVFYKKLYLRYKNKIQEADPSHLTKQEAFRRSSLIKNLSYTLYLDLTTRGTFAYQKRYDGQILISFHLQGLEDVFIDFTGKVKNLHVNGVELKNFTHTANRIFLDHKNLKLENNKVLIIFDNNYCSESHGIRFWTDPKDNNDYIYTCLEPCLAHTVFPCFDQPDLKAKIKLFTTNENTWEVVSNSNLITKYVNENDRDNQFKVMKTNYNFIINHVRKDFALYEFVETELMPVYSFLLGAGKFTTIDEIPYEDDNLEHCPKMRIYLRESLNDKIVEQEVFHKARGYVNWFCEKYEMKIPFCKLDLVFLPDMHCVTMEHVGGITIDDRYVQRNLNPTDYDEFNMILAQGVAHIWFGNYVTPKWWNDLWIKESLSTYLAAECLTGLAEKYKNTDNTKNLEFLRLNKIWQYLCSLKSEAYIVDQFESTHSLNTTCEDSHHAESLYDGFLQNKGSAIIKYFHSIIGSKNFDAGLKSLISKYGYGNIGYPEFKNTFEEILKPVSQDQVNPFEYIEPYFNFKGMNKLTLNVIYDEKLDFQKVTIVQKNACHEKIKENFYNYTFDILLIYEGGKEELITNVNVSAQRTTDITSYFQTKQKPEAIILNPNDKAYFCQVFEEKSALWLIDHIHTIESPITILVIARDLFDCVRDAQTNPFNYINFVQDLLVKRTNLDHQVIRQILSFAIYVATHCILIDYQAVAKNILFNLINDIALVHINLKDLLVNFLLDIFDTTNQQHNKFLLSCIKDNNFQQNMNQDKQQNDLLIERDSSFISNNSFIKQQSFEFSVDTNGFNFSTKLRILENVFSIPEAECSYKKKLNILENYELFDPDFKELTYIKVTLDACLPDIEKKEKYWNLIKLKTEKLPFNEYVAIMKGFAKNGQYDLLKIFYKEKFFQEFFFIKRSNGIYYALTFFKFLNPSFIVSQEILDKLEWLNNNRIPDKEYLLKKEISRTVSELEMNLKVANKYKHQHEEYLQKYIQSKNK